MRALPPWSYPTFRPMNRTGKWYIKSAARNTTLIPIFLPPFSPLRQELFFVSIPFSEKGLQAFFPFLTRLVYLANIFYFLRENADGQNVENWSCVALPCPGFDNIRSAWMGIQEYWRPAVGIHEHSEYRPVRPESHVYYTFQ